MRLGLEGRRALVTGAASGIGRAVARRLVEEGARVALLDRDGEGVRASAAEHHADRAIALVADLTSEPEVSAAVGAALNVFGGLDLVVGCAGISGPMGRGIEDVTLAEWNAVLAVNVTGNFLVLRHALPALRASAAASAAASVVLIASDSALVAAPGMVPYCTSKAAVVQLARALSVDLASDGIRVNAICPSIVDTAMSRADLGLEDVGFAGVDYPVQAASEVADQVAFLCSPRSRPVNGAALVSDFGYTARSSFPA